MNALGIASVAALAAAHLHGPATAVSRPGLGVFSHVVIVVQENRSFDNLFQGYPGANTVASGVTSTGQTVPLQPIPIGGGFDINHRLSDFVAACDGTGSLPGTNCRNDAFDLEAWGGSQQYGTLPMYSYVPSSDTQQYFALAQQYVLADDNFASHLDASFVGHQYLIAAQAQAAVDIPMGKWGCGSQVDTITQGRTIGPTEPACFEETTLSDEVDQAGLKWKLYAPRKKDPGFNWVGYQAIDHIRNGPEWKKNVVSPNTKLLSDITAGKLPSVSWVIPAYAESDHEGAGDQLGEQWVSTVVNAVGQSPYWSNTAIVVVWDDWGGFYDHVAPPYEDYDGLGFRTPLLVISAYSKQNYVSHVQYEFGSILQFVEDVFSLGRLAASDTRANSLVPDCFTFPSRPRPFVPVRTSMTPQQLERAVASQPIYVDPAAGD
jgi:phospholipase C